MKNRTHLFLATFPSSVGEITLALRVADDLHQQGDRIVFLICQSHAKIFTDKPYEFVLIDSMMTTLDDHMDELIEKYNPDSLILVDLHSNAVWLNHLKQGTWFFKQNRVPVLAMDIYHLTEKVKYADVFLNHESHVGYLSSIPKGLISPVPFIAPHATPNAYNALPPAIEMNEQSKKEIKQELGISNDEKLILMVGAHWQTPKFWQDIHARRLSIYVPNLTTYYLSLIDSKVRVVHIGPEPYHISKNLNGRYLWLQQMNPQRFQSLLAAADLFVSFNVTATTLSSAIMLGVPILIIRNSIKAMSVDEALSKISNHPSEALLHWLAIATPLYPFYVWPGGYYRVLSPVLENNPFCETFLMSDLLDEQQVTQTCRELLYNEGTRERIKEQQSKYVSLVRSLPRGADLIQQHLSAL
jgi:Family of unknown function (DUF6365)